MQFEAGKSYLLSAWVRYAPGTAESEWYIRPADVGNDFDYANRGSAIIDGNADFTEIRVIYNCTKAGQQVVSMWARQVGVPQPVILTIVVR